MKDLPNIVTSDSSDGSGDEDDLDHESSTGRDRDILAFYRRSP